MDVTSFQGGGRSNRLTQTVGAVDMCFGVVNIGDCGPRIYRFLSFSSSSGNRKSSFLGNLFTDLIILLLFDFHCFLRSFEINTFHKRESNPPKMSTKLAKSSDE